MYDVRPTIERWCDESEMRVFILNNAPLFCELHGGSRAGGISGACYCEIEVVSLSTRPYM
jgi:hypothetical protein